MTYTKSFMAALVLATVVGVALAAPTDKRSERYYEVDESEEVVIEDDEPLAVDHNRASEFLFNNKAVTSTSEASFKPESEENGNGRKPGNGNGGKPGHSNGGKPGNGNGEKPETGNEGKPGNGNGGAPLHQHQQRPMNGFLDKVFAIPINILHSVNMLLNQKYQYMVQQASAGEDAEASGQGKPGAPQTIPTQTIYDGIFNIPITILKSVMNLLKWLAN